MLVHIGNAVSIGFLHVGGNVDYFDRIPLGTGIFFQLI